MKVFGLMLWLSCICGEPHHAIPMPTSEACNAVGIIITREMGMQWRCGFIDGPPPDCSDCGSNGYYP